jgi:urease accessory protein
VFNINKFSLNFFKSKLQLLNINPVRNLRAIAIATISSIALLWSTQQAIAHHAMGGEIPTNFIEGFISGLAHPIIGLDHFAFVVASGLIAARLVNGIYIPIFFILTAMLGTGIHLLKLDLPFPEVLIACSVIAFGTILASKNTRHLQTKLSVGVITTIAAIAGIFHGYAYGESIVGAQMSSLFAYLAGFSIIQSIVALSSLFLGKTMLSKLGDRPSVILQFLGLTVGAIGMVFLVSAV